jgi:hypothetical protein
MTHGRLDGHTMHDAGDGFIGWIGHGSWIRYSDVDLQAGITGATLAYSSGWIAEPRTVEVWVAPSGSGRPDHGELAAIIHADASTGSYEAGSAIQVDATFVAPTPGGIHDVYVLFRGQEFNFGALKLTLAQPAAPAPLIRSKDDAPPRPPKPRTPRSRAGDHHMTLAQGASVTPEIAWPNNPRAQVRWKSSDPAIASVTSRGTITAREPGVADITVTSQGTVVTFRVRVVGSRSRG